MQNARSVTANINPSADFAECACLFIDLHVKSCAQQARCCGEPANATAYCRD